MTTRFEGTIKLEGEKVVMPTNTRIPPKQEWGKYSIFQFNGKRYTPLTQMATDNVDTVVKELQKLGKTKAHKAGARKSTSIKYAVLTTGCEEFSLI